MNFFYEYLGRELAAHGWGYTLIPAQNKTRIYRLGDDDSAIVLDGIRSETLRAFLLGLEAQTAAPQPQEPQNAV